MSCYLVWLKDTQYQNPRKQNFELSEKSLLKEYEYRSTDLSETSKLQFFAWKRILSAVLSLILDIIILACLKYISKFTRQECFTGIWLKISYLINFSFKYNWNLISDNIISSKFSFHIWQERWKNWIQLWCALCIINIFNIFIFWKLKKIPLFFQMV